MQSPSSLHLLLPGLLWPAAPLRDLVFDLDLPAFATLAGYGKRRMYPAPNNIAWLSDIVGAPSLDVASLRLAAADASPAPGAWLCLDPVYLRLEKTHLILEDPSRLELSLSDAQALAADLEAVFAELGTLYVTQAGHWHIHLHDISPVEGTPLLEAIGLNAETLMPASAQIRIWRRCLNEAQMVLHTHPVNTQRQQQGLLPVNSVWPWGFSLIGSDTQIVTLPWKHIVSNNPLLVGLARQQDIPVSTDVSKFNLKSGKSLVSIEQLDSAFRLRDAMRWRSEMLALEQNWFAPLLLALRRGELDSVVLHGSGTGQALSIECGRRDHWRVWRQPAALDVLGV